MEEENQTSKPTNDEKGFSAANQQQNKNTEQNQNQPSSRRMISNKGGQGRFFGLRKYFIDDELEGESAAAETLSAPGDLSKLPKAWRHNMDFLRQSRATTQQPGTSQQQSSAGNEDDDKKTTSSKTKATTPPTVQASMRRGQKDAAIPLLNGQSQQSTCRQQQQQQQPRKRGHLRGTRSNEFASGPPFPKKRNADHKRKGELPANTSSEEDEYDDDYPRPLNERQKQQQMALIEHELNVMADQTKCGISRWRPAWLQRFARKQWMLFLLCWFCAIQGMIVSGLFPSSISTIERRFQFSTSTMGRIMQFYEFGYVLFCIPVSYFGGRHSKSTVLGAGLFLMSLGSLVFTLPHFIAEPYTSSYQADASDLQSKCPDNGLTSQSAKESLFGLGARPEPLTACPSPENQPGTFRYVFLFCLAHFMHGVGATPLFTIGVSYIDENVGPALSSLYIGIFYTFAIFGPAIGFFASSKFLLWHSDFMVTGQKMQKLIIDLDETDPKWVGAWYIGFILAALLGLLAVFPILILPKLLPESLKWHRTRLQEEKLGTKKRTPECCGMPSSNRTAAVFSSRNGGLSEDDAAENGSNSRQHIVQFQSPSLKNQKAPIWYQLWLDVRHIPIAIYKILANGPYMLLTFAMSISGLILTGCSTFMSKYLERQFGVAPSKATLFMGAIMVPMAGFGTMFSGLIINRFRLSCARTLQYCIVLVLCSLLLSPMYFIYCDHDQLVGIERHYPVNDTPANHYDAATDSYMYRLEVQCNARCHCSSAEYHPVCAERIDGSQMAFYSPCYAGCPQAYSSSLKEYSNCSCAPDEIKGQQRKVKKGYCESKCRGLFAFMVFFAPFCFFVFAVAIAMIIVVLRTVDYDERSFALGIQWILVRVIGTIPAPVVFGWLFDFSCIRQHFDPCSGEHGSCMLYNNKSLADLFLAFTVAGQLVALVCLIGVLMFFAGSLHDDPLPATAADAPNEMECKTAVEFGISGSSSKRHSRRSQQREEEGKDCGEEEKTPLAEKEKRPSSPAESGANGSSCRDEHHLDTARDDA